MIEAGKRLQLLVRGDGRILTFKADPGVVSGMFGQDAEGLTKKVRLGPLPAAGGNAVRVGERIGCMRCLPW